MGHSILLSAIFLFCFSALVAQQNYTVSETTAIPLAATVNLQSVEIDYSPRLQHMEMPAPGSDSYRGYLSGLKRNMGEKNYMAPRRKKTSSLPPPTIGANFEGNLFQSGVPNDNTLAISNDGKIISIINSNILVTDTAGNEIKAISLAAFSESLNLAAHKYDPRVVYDPQADRFVMVFLNGNKDTNSFNVFAFSNTNDPAGDWNLYTIPGNPLNDSSWSDFPMIALTEDEVFYTINLLENNKPWQEAFKQTLIWQIDKWSGYNGEPLISRYFGNINYLGKPLRNVCPAQGGLDLSGPDMYFLSNRNFDTINDTFFVIHLSGKLGENGIVSVKPVKAGMSYGVPPFARQPGPGEKEFDTNDGRVLDAKYENGKIVFVANTRNFSNNLSAVYLGVVENIEGNTIIKGKLIENDMMDLGYPALAYSGDGTDDDYIIVFNHSSPEVFPGNSAVYYRNGELSEQIVLKEGESYVTVLGGSYERWGDYSGAQLKYNEPGVVWVAAGWGKQRTVTNPLQARRVHATWISRLQKEDVPEILPTEASVKTYPVPLYPDRITGSREFHMEFLLPQDEFLEIALYDMSGRLLTILLREQGKAGKNKFTFSTQPLQTGTYLLRIQSVNYQFNTQKLLVVE